MSKVVLDSSAVIAFLFAEAGAESVRSYLGHAYLSTVNLVEVLSVATDRGFDADKIQASLVPLVELIHFDVKQAAFCGELRPLTKAFGLSLGDRACLALAHHLKKPVLTADKIWQNLELNIEINLIR